MAKEINVQELKRRQDAGPVKLIDVREPHEYEEDNLGGQSIPLSTVPDQLEAIGSKDEEIIVHCRSGKRSAQAQRYLESEGYSNVHNLTGGILAYREAFPK